MAIHKYLFFIEENQVMVYCYNEKKGEFKYEKNEGEERFPLSKDFWAWWKEAASFNRNNDSVDFCFICDKICDYINHDFNKADKSIWEKSVIQKFFMTQIKYSHIRLKNEEQIIIKSYDKENTMFSDNSIRIFYTNLYKESEKSSEGISPLCEYFRNKIENENSN